uniref:hypothetical protein n=1 Tax=Roseivirga sp. TaxID=1964215 RepID=UPI0040474E95
MEVKNYTGQNLKGTWDISFKLDGFQVIYKGGKATTRGGITLNHFPKMDDGIYEYFKRNWAESIAALSPKEQVVKHNLYRIDLPDRAILMTVLNHPTSKQIQSYYKVAVATGFEGIVLHKEGTYLRIKPSHTHDVVITRMLPGFGPYEGMLGSIETDYGKVSMGLSIEERKQFWTNRKAMIGQTIECKCKSITATGKMREPVFLRRRVDKNSELVNC